MILERFQADFGEYENLNVSESTLETLRISVIAFFAAIIVATVVISVERKLFGGLVHRLLEQGANSPEMGKTVSELGMKNNLAVKLALRMGGQYRGVVHCAEEDAYNDLQEKIRAQKAMEYAAGEAKNPYTKSKKYVYQFETNHFFIPEEKAIEASRRFERKGTSLPSLIFILLLSLLAMFVIIFFLPDLVQLMDNVVGIIKSA